MLSGLLALLVVGFVMLLVFGVAIVVLGAVLGIAFAATSFLLFKVAPVLLLGWLAWKVVGRARSPRRITEADRRWLDG